ncbi:hypothetical protein [Ruania rhizosphaerae]|uniref:hypothetical protein n=1 Tax=Ruania rhizosphaerae TaxID=1840413 RepID=UPI001357A02C|nr:hypothetical protein [Ruania rhizosphaerae]
MRPRLSLLLGVLLVLAAGVGVNALTDRTEPSGSVSTRFALGEDVRIGEFQVHVHDVRAAQTLDDDGVPLQTSGIWVIVDYSAATTREPAYSPNLGLRDSEGRTYSISSRSPVSDWRVAPDTWTRGEVAFEVAADALGDLTLYVWAYPRTVAEDVPVGYGVTTISLEEISADRVILDEPELLGEGER